MKKLITLSILVLVVMLSGVEACAQLNNNLVVFSNGGERFYLILNGVKQNGTSQTNVKVTSLSNPNYKVKIIFENKGIPDIDQTIYTMDGGEQKNNYEFTCSITKTKKGYRLRYMSAAPFASAQSSPDQHTVMYTTGQPSDAGTTVTTTGTGGTYGGGTVVGMNGGMDGGSSTTTTTTSTNGTNTGTVGMNVGVNANGSGLNMNVTVNDGSTGGTGINGRNQTTTTHTTTTASGTGMSSATTTSGTGNSGVNMNVTTTGTGMNATGNMNGGNGGPGGTNYTQSTNTNTSTTNYVPGYNGPYGCSGPMSDNDFADAKKSIEAKSFEDSKLTIAKQIINSHCLLCSQVKEVMLLFSFENTRLDLAKYSYGRTYDQGDYYKLNDAFTFESSIDELNKYIGGK